MCPEIPQTDHPINKKELLSDHIDFEGMNAYIDGVLERDEINRIENHLVRCKACRSIYDEILSLFEDLEILNSFPLEIDIVSDVMDNLNSENKFPELLKWGSIFQTLIVLVGVSILTPIFINQKLFGGLHQIVRITFKSMGNWFISILSIVSNQIISILEFQPRLDLIQFLNQFHLSDLSLWAVILPSIILCIGANVLLLRGNGRKKSSENFQI